MNVPTLSQSCRDNPHYDLCSASSEVFYKSQVWLDFRFKYLRTHLRICRLCGQGPGEGIAIQLDHIRPRSLYPELALEERNIQVLCAPCNKGKGLQEFKIKIIRRIN